MYDADRGTVVFIFIRSFDIQTKLITEKNDRLKTKNQKKKKPQNRGKWANIVEPTRWEGGAIR